MRRVDVLFDMAVKECVAIAPRLKDQQDGYWKGVLKDKIHFILGCKVSGSTFSNTDPFYPIVVLKCGKFKSRIRVTPGQVVSTILSPLIPFLGNLYEREKCLEVLRGLMAEDGERVETLVKDAACKLANNPFRLQKKKDQMAAQEQARRDAQFAQLRREMTFYIKGGLTEEDIVRVFRECQLQEVQDS